MNLALNNSLTKKTLLFTSFSILAGIVSFPQPSQAFDFDHAMKEILCRTMVLQTGQCSPQRLNPPTSTYPNTPSYPTLNYPQAPDTNPNIPQYPPSIPANEEEQKYPTTYPYNYLPQYPSPKDSSSY